MRTDKFYVIMNNDYALRGSLHKPQRFAMSFKLVQRHHSQLHPNTFPEDTSMSLLEWHQRHE